MQLSLATFVCLKCVVIMRVRVAGDGLTRLVNVPRFSTTGTAVLLNLATLDCEPIVFASEIATAVMGDE